jgi:hypothetical protein
MAVTYYERKVIQRTVGVLNTTGVSFERVTAGILDGKRAICAVLTPQTKSDEIANLQENLQKYFRKATVKVGRGATRPYCPETVYQTVYITFDK